MKIFVTIGTQLPFDRLIKEVDQWAAKRQDIGFVAQIGDAGYIPKFMDYYHMLDAEKFNYIFQESDLLISHAGMGIILTALVNKKPLLVMPRKKHLNEVNTDHQVATARAFERLDLLHVAWDNQQLVSLLENPELINACKPIRPHASKELIDGIRNFIEKV